MKRINIDSPTAEHFLGIIERGFPLTPAPFEVLGARLGLDTSDVLDCIASFKESGLIRQIGPVYDPKRLGYKTALIGVRTDEIEVAASRLVGCRGVSHAYEREYGVNLWFTLVVPEGVSVASVVTDVLGEVIVGEVLVLPSVRTFKLQSGFACRNKDLEPAEEISALSGISILSELEKKVVNGLPYDLPLNLRPFDALAGGLGLSVEDFLETCQRLLRWGIMKRYSAAVNHLQLGLVANAMACWSVPEELVALVAHELVLFSEVSHCYERETVPGWRFNLFAMIHASSRSSCFDIIERVCRSTGQADRVVLFSTKELIKRRTEYWV